MNTRLLWLDDDTDATRSLLLGARGEVLARETLGKGVTPTGEAARTWAIVPGHALRVLWMPLPARSAAQAQALARTRLQGEWVAEPLERLHVAVGGTLEDERHPVAVVAHARMQTWLAQAGALGLRLDGMLPDCLAVPAPEHGVRIVQWHGDALVRGPQLAFRAPPELAQRLLAQVPAEDCTRHAEDESERLMLKGISSPAINLMQAPFAARRPTHPLLSRRSLAAMLCALLLSPMLLSAVDGLRYRRAAEALRAEDRAAIDRALPGRPASMDAATWLQDAATRQAHRRELPARLQALAQAVQASPDSRIDLLHLDAQGVISATVLHADADALAQVLARLQAGGWPARAGDSRNEGTQMASEIVLEPGVGR
ncbi:type II secretion system protein GspL [Luteimonas sp. e5]